MIFADSSYFVALWDPLDKHHEQAERTDHLLLEGGLVRGLSGFVTILPMAAEVGECITRASGPHHGLERFREIINNCRVIIPDKSLVLRAFEETYRVYADVRTKRKPGIIDSIGVAAMRKEKVLQLVSFDKGFDLVPDIRRLILIDSPHGFELSL